MNKLRKKLYDIIEVTKDKDKLSKVYNGFMLFVIVLSLIPLCLKSQNVWINYVDRVTVFIFILDYVFRWITADFKFQEKVRKPFLRYPFTAMAIIDLLSILPSITFIYPGLKLLKLFRLVRTFRIFKFVRYLKSIRIIVNVLKKEKDVLLAVCYLLVNDSTNYSRLR